MGTRQGLGLRPLCNFPLDKIETNGYYNIMTGQELREWRKKWKITQEQLAEDLGVYRVSVNRWERGVRSIPSFLHLALEALEYRLKKGGKNELSGRMP